MFVRLKLKRLELVPQRVHTRLAPHRDFRSLGKLVAIHDGLGRASLDTRSAT